MKRITITRPDPRSPGYVLAPLVSLGDNLQILHGGVLMWRELEPRPNGGHAERVRLLNSGQWLEVTAGDPPPEEETP